MIRTLLGLVLMVGIVGCSGGEKDSGMIKAKGKLLKNGSPLTMDMSKLPPGEQGMAVTFYPEDGGEEEQADINGKEGTFTLPGRGKGVKPGKYKVAIVMGAFGEGDKLKGKFSKERTQIVREVKNESEEIVIDIEKP